MAQKSTLNSFIIFSGQIILFVLKHIIASISLPQKSQLDCMELEIDSNNNIEIHFARTSKNVD